MLLYTSRGIVIGKADNGYPNYGVPHSSTSNPNPKPKEEDFIKEKEFKV